MAKSNVAYALPVHTKLRKSWRLIRDVLEGEAAVKAAKRVYLPMPNPEDDSSENVERYKAYVERAAFMPFTFRTQQGLVGQVFFRDPVVKIPATMPFLENNINGNGLSLTQQARRVVLEVTGLGRHGLLADYPNVEGPASQADLNSGRVRPTVVQWQAEDIINWRTKVVGGVHVLTLVVLSEQWCCKDDGFKQDFKPQYRVLRLEDGVGYTVEIWREQEEGNEIVVHEKYTPKMGNGKPWDHIPFYFIGSENNDPDPDKPPLEDLARLNIAHYRNSADYEESVFMVGQPTPWIAGVNESWVRDVLKGTIYLGSRGLVPLPMGGQAGLLQATANTLAFGAMEHKEKQAVSLGAKLIENQQVQRTATEVSSEAVVENSVLATIAHNVSDAYVKVLTDCVAFTTVTPGTIEFELNTDFEITSQSPQERAQLIAEWQADAISFEEMRYNLKQAGVAYLDDKKARAQIDSEEPGPQLDEVDNNGDGAQDSTD